MAQAGRKKGPAVESARAENQPCETCGSPELMTIRMTLNDGPVVVRVCTECDTRTWHRDGSPVEIGDLVAAMRGTTRRR